MPSADIASPIVRVQNLGVTLDRRTILRNVSFDIVAGECLAIIGTNGCGKTILLKSLLGIVPHEGTIAWRDGVTIGYVPQKIEADRNVPLDVRNLLVSAVTSMLSVGAGFIAAHYSHLALGPCIVGIASAMFVLSVLKHGE